MPLGANECIEHFPVGKRLAFDSAKGRLWAVCRRCRQWNLTPLEERWEAIDECERAFRRSRPRETSENIGLAVSPDGLELVRVGAPLRRELAEWRYGPRFRSRRRTHLTTLAAYLAGGPLLSLAVQLLDWRSAKEARVRTMVARRHLAAACGLDQNSSPPRFWETKLVAHSDAQGWAIRLRSARSQDPLVVTGDQALRLLYGLLPSINRLGGTARQLDEAVLQMGSVSAPAQYFAHALDLLRQGGHVYSSLASYPAPLRLALEMASQEECEGRALEGEAAMLEAAWRDAEEVAKIADDLLLPASVRERLGVLGAGR
jgi:hypothetical protein